MVIYVSISTRAGDPIANRVMVDVLPGGTVVQTAKMVRKTMADERNVKPSLLRFAAYAAAVGTDALAVSA